MDYANKELGYSPESVYTYIWQQNFIVIMKPQLSFTQNSVQCLFYRNFSLIISTKLGLYTVNTFVKWFIRDPNSTELSCE